MDEKQTAALREVFEALVSEWGWDLRREANDTNEYLLASTAAAWGGFLACYQHLAQWQPIETAPKDGTAIVIARIEDGTVYDLCNGHFEVVGEMKKTAHGTSVVASHGVHTLAVVRALISQRGCLERSGSRAGR